MAVANTKSAAITGLDALPTTYPSATVDGGFLRTSVGTVEVAAADDNNSVFRLIRLRSSARLEQLTIWNDAITGGTSYDVGLYRTAKDGGAAVDSDLFATAVDLSSASTGAGTDVLTEATAANIDKIEKRLWELLGLTADPLVDYDVCLTGGTVGSAAGTISARARFVLT